ELKNNKPKESDEKELAQWEIDVAELEFRVEHNISWSDWRSNFLYMVFGSYRLVYGDKTLQPLGDEAKQMLIDQDWRALYELMLERMDIELKYEEYGYSDEQIERFKWFYRYSLDKDISPVEGDWKYAIANELQYLKSDLADMEENEEAGSNSGDDNAKLEEYKDKIALYEYRIDNDVSRNVSYSGLFDDMMMMSYGYEKTPTDIWKMLNACIMMFPFMSVFVIIIAGGLVSGEFSSGTIKFLLINPVKRWKILVSKYIVMLMAGAAFLAVVFGVFFFLGGALTGFQNMGAVNLTVSKQVISSTPAFIYFFKLLLLGSVNVFVMATMAFALSAATRNTGLSIAVSIAALIGGNIINMIMRFIVQVDWGRYLIFANVDLVTIVHGGSTPLDAPYPGQTLAFSIGVIAVHMVIFLLMAWDGFTKREL
ncbi:MAG: ABC transporter permease, partial [Oscillospiraceae bacterium]|nr:ABC transporter permease [Oscillospiraceae bacterium]